MIHSLCQTKPLSFTLSACFFLAALTVLLSLCPFALSFTLFVYGSAPRDASRLVQNAGAPAASLSPGLRSAPRPAPSQRLHSNNPAAAFYLEYFFIFLFSTSSVFVKCYVPFFQLGRTPFRMLHVQITPKCHLQLKNTFAAV